MQHHKNISHHNNHIILQANRKQQYLQL